MTVRNFVERWLTVNVHPGEYLDLDSAETLELTKRLIAAADDADIFKDQLLREWGSSIEGAIIQARSLANNMHVGPYGKGPEVA
jgi:hypothetical protein